VQKTAQGVTAFYDIDTPVTLAKLSRGDYEYLSPELIPGYHLYLSFTGGPTLSVLEHRWGSPCARPLYCAFDSELYAPEPNARTVADLGYMGTYSPDRQPTVEALLLEPARQLPHQRFIVAGAQYPPVSWPANVQHIEHLPPSEHRAFYTGLRYTLNVTREDMIQAGYSPSVRLFEAAACATPIISDIWDGLDTFFTPNEEILLARNTNDALQILRDLPESERQAIGERARARVAAHHTSAHRAGELLGYLQEVGAGGQLTSHISTSDG
jgi:spore maturation protein CgeB